MTYSFQPQILDFGVFFRGHDPDGRTSYPLFALAAAGSAPGLPASVSFKPADASVVVPGILSPPGPSATIHITDPSGPGDVFRSGLQTSWPREPVTLMIFALPRGPSAALGTTTGTTFSYGSLAARAAVPIAVTVPTGFQIAIGAGSLSGFVPRRIVITGVTITQLAGATDAVTISFTGKVDYRQLVFIARTSLFAGTINVAISPSGNASNTADVVHATTSGFTFSIPDFGPLAGPAIAGFGSLFAGVLSGVITAAINTGIARSVAEAAANPQIGGMVSGLVPSVRRVATSPTALTLDIYASGLFPQPAVQPVLRDLAVAISPAPVADTAGQYTVTVTDRLNHGAIAGATVTLKNYASRNALQPGSTSFTTDAHGHASIHATLHFGLRPDPRGRNGVPDGTLLPPTLTVTAAGHNPHSQDLLTV